MTSSQITDITNYINNYRAIHRAPPLKWDPDIQVFSQNWSDHLLMSNSFGHSETSLYGENLAYFRGYGVDIPTLLKLSIDAWYNEVSLYDYYVPGFQT